MRKFVITVLSLIAFNAAFATVDSTLKEFTGKYVFPDGSVISEVSVTLDGDALSITAPMGTSALERKEGDAFTIVQYNGTALFTRDANKKVTGVTIDAMGYHLEGTKSGNGFTFIVYRKPQFFATHSFTKK